MSESCATTSSSWECFALPLEWAKDKRMNWATKNLLSKVYFLTKKGSITKRISNSFFLELGFSIWELRQGWKILTQLGFIEKTLDRKNGNATYVKLLNIPTPFNCKGMPASTSSENHTSSSENLTTYRENLTSLERDTQDPYESSSQHTIVNKEYTENNTKVFSVEATQNFVASTQEEKEQEQEQEISLDATSSESEVMTEAKVEDKKSNALTGNLLSNKAFPDAIQICTDLARSIVQENLGVTPALSSINCHDEAIKFVNHYAMNDWRAKGSKSRLKNVKLALRNWLFNSLSFRANTYNYAPKNNNPASFGGAYATAPVAQTGKFAQEVQFAPTAQVGKFQA